MAEDYDLSGVHVFAAGEKLRNFHPCSSENILINLYGSTEVCPIVSKKIQKRKHFIPTAFLSQRLFYPNVISRCSPATSLYTSHPLVLTS